VEYILLIVPEGIEISEFQALRVKLEKLLIVPEGIEIREAPPVGFK